MEKISRTLVTNQITDYIKKRITSGDWKLGEKIPSEPVLSRELGVSRASLRAAIQRFVTLRILKPEQGRGCFLISNEIDRLGNGPVPIQAYRDIRAVLEYRLLVEPQGLSWALRRDRAVIDDLVEKMKVSFEKMRNSLGDPQVFIAADLDFHRAIAEASGNEVLSDSLSRVFANTAVSHERMNDLFGYECGLKYHDRILKAVIDQDDRRAVRQLERHFTVAIEELDKKEG